MTNIRLRPDQSAEKAKTARKDAPDIAALRKIRDAKDGAFFLVENRLYVWVASDLRPDDGLNSIIPEGADPSSLGRFRRVIGYIEAV